MRSLWIGGQRAWANGVIAPRWVQSRARIEHRSDTEMMPVGLHTARWLAPGTRLPTRNSAALPPCAANCFRVRPGVYSNLAFPGRTGRGRSREYVPNVEIERIIIGSARPSWGHVPRMTNEICILALEHQRAELRILED